MATPRTILFVALLVFSSAMQAQDKQGSDSKDAAKCNAQAHGYWDAPPQFWEKFWKECPPEQVGRLGRERIYASRADLRPTLKKGGVLSLPLSSKRASADVWLSVIVSTRGRVMETALVQSAGDDALDKRAVKEVKSWHFKPATRNGKAVAVKETVVVHFERTTG